MEFKGSKKIHAVEYAGVIRLNNKPHYEGLDLLNFEDVGEEVAKANAKLYEASYDLLEALHDLLVHAVENDLHSEFTNKAEIAIKKALK